MFGRSRAAMLRTAMTEVRSDQTRVSRTAGHLVFGVDDRIASTVFGAITVMATVAADAAAFPDHPWDLVLLVPLTAVVLWAAHLYAHGLSESISEGRLLRPDLLLTLARRELGIVLAAVPPTAALVLGGIGLIDEPAAVWLALAAGLATLGAQGLRYARVESLGYLGTFVAVAANVGLGLIVVALKISVLH
jgi:hypothetical protein